MSENEPTVEEIVIAQNLVDKVRAQNWKNGGVHIMDCDEAEDLIAKALADSRNTRPSPAVPVVGGLVESAIAAAALRVSSDSILCQGKFAKCFKRCGDACICLQTTRSAIRAALAALSPPTAKEDER